MTAEILLMIVICGQTLNLIAIVVLAGDVRAMRRQLERPRIKEQISKGKRAL